MKNLKKIFTKIYDENVEKIYRFIFLKVDSKETAQDLTSKTFLKTWEAFKEKKIENPRAFLYQVARNVIKDYYREKEKASIISLEEISLSDSFQEFQEKVNLNSEIERMKKALKELDEDYQNVLIWYYLDEIPIKEIAKMLNKTEGNIRVLIHRALNALREKLNFQKV